VPATKNAPRGPCLSVSAAASDPIGADLSQVDAVRRDGAARAAALAAPILAEVHRTVGFLKP
jgi:hypothetical protein